MRINTVYQLMHFKYNEPEMLENTEKLLLIPDLFAYMLTGLCAQKQVLHLQPIFMTLINAIGKMHIKNI